MAVDEAGLAEAFTDPSVITALEASGAGAVLVTGPDRPLVIVTGNASATNSSVVVLCQRADLLELTCLRPPAEEPPPPASEPPTVTPLTPTASTPATATAPAKTAAVQQSAAARSLPATGSDPSRLILAALALLLFGSSLIVVSRRAT